MDTRLDKFAGNDTEYIAYLERAVISLRTHHQSCSPSSTTRSEDNLSIIPWVPGSPLAKKQRTATPAWKATARNIVESTPKANKWWEVVHEKGIYEALSNGNAAAYILDCNCSLGEPGNEAALLAQPTAIRQQGLLARLAAYAHIATKRETTASAAIMLANFQKFLVLSSCAVLYHTESPRDEVFNIVKICIGQVQDRYCQQTIRTVIWMNRLVDMLSSHGWDNRASDLLLIWNKPPTAYHAVASSPELSLKYFKDELTQGQFTRGVDRGKWIPLFIPCLVHQILEKRVSVSRIGHILEYTFDNRVNPWRFSSSVREVKDCQSTMAV